MNKILATTDLSTNSKAGLRFAMQLADQLKCELIFYYAIEVLKPISWSSQKYDSYLNLEKESYKPLLEKFIIELYAKSGLKPVKYTCIVETGEFFDKMVVNLGIKTKADFICLSTRGAGLIKEIFGSNTSDLIEISPIPIFVIPSNYRAKPITKITYASDLEQLNVELKLVEKLNNQLKTSLDVVHFQNISEFETNKLKFEQLAAKHEQENITFYFKIYELDFSMSDQLQSFSKKTKSSLLVLFTKAHKNWIQKFFNASNASQLTYDGKIPLLVFHKP